MNSAFGLRHVLNGRAAAVAAAAAVAVAVSLHLVGCVGGSGTTASSSTETGTTTDTTSVECTDVLPPMGSPCSEEGEDCAPDSDPCFRYPIATCKGGLWQHGEAGPGDPAICTKVPCGTEVVPPEGSMCATPGESCAPHKDPCLPYTDAICTDGAWLYTYIGPGDPNECGFPCDLEKIPPEGSVCAMEGESCSVGCENPCEFCNALVCEEGAWQYVEDFPSECLSCDELCPAVVMAACFGGPPDQEACVAGCMDTQGGECGLSFDNMLACVGAEPTFMCQDDGLPTVEGCEEAFSTLYACMMP